MMNKEKKGIMRYGLLVLAVIGSFTLTSWKGVSESGLPQTTIKKDTAQQDELDQQPEFAGGFDALSAYLQKNLKYPESAKEEGLEGTVYVAFTVTDKGAITNVTPKRGVSDDLDNEALRVIKSMPDWKPGIKDGKPVNAEMVLPIAFRLS